MNDSICHRNFYLYSPRKMEKTPQEMPFLLQENSFFVIKTQKSTLVTEPLSHEFITDHCSKRRLEDKCAIILEKSSKNFVPSQKLVSVC